MQAGRKREVAVMKGTTTPMKVKRRMMLVPALAKHELMIRRDGKHNTHVITHHGKVFFGRKGRKG